MIVTCNKCDRRVSCAARSERDAIAIAMALGWTLIRSRPTCGPCSLNAMGNAAIAGVGQLRDISPSFRVAAEAFETAAAHNAPPALATALFALCQREAALVEAQMPQAPAAAPEAVGC